GRGVSWSVRRRVGWCIGGGVGRSVGWSVRRRIGWSIGWRRSVGRSVRGGVGRRVRGSGRGGGRGGVGRGVRGGMSRGPGGGVSWSVGRRRSVGDHCACRCGGGYSSALDLVVAITDRGTVQGIPLEVVWSTTNTARSFACSPAPRSEAGRGVAADQ